MTPVPRARAPYIYRLAFIVPVAAVGYLALSGRWRAYFALMRSSGSEATPEAFFDSFLSGLIWIISIAPLMFLAWELGSQHTRARRWGFDVWVGLREAFRIATIGGGMTDQAAAFERAPTDRPWLAAVLGLLVLVAVPIFFMTVVPDLRGNRPIVWLGGTGALFGILSYCHIRAAAYLVDEPPATLFRNWARLNPARYAEAGRPFVYCQTVVTVILPIWWLGGGVLAFR